MSNLVFAIPSKGRLKEQCEAFLADCGLALTQEGGDRGYRGMIKSAPGVEVRLASAQEIANGVLFGELHAGITGEDLLRESAGDFTAQVLPVKALGFGRADVIVAAPQSWIDVDDMADLEALAHEFPDRYGRRMRAATKYMNLARSFFAAHNMSGCRVLESLSATEGAPAAGAADIIVDITTTGSTLAANKLKIVGGGVILKSQAILAVSRNAAWRLKRARTLNAFSTSLRRGPKAKRSRCCVSAIVSLFRLQIYWLRLAPPLRQSERPNRWAALCIARGSGRAMQRCVCRRRAPDPSRY